MKDPALRVIILGSISSIVATIIVKFATTNHDYSWVPKLFTSTINIPSWVLFLLIMLPALLIYNSILSLRHKKPKTQHYKKQKDGIQNIKTHNDNLSDDIWINYFFEERYEEAKAQIELTITSKPDSEKIEDFGWLTYINYKIQKNNCIDTFIELSNKYIDNLEVQRQVAQFLVWENYKKEAINFIGEQLSKFPSDTKLIILLAESYKKSEPDQSINILIKADPDKNPKIAIELSKMYYDKDDLDKAVDVLIGSHDHVSTDTQVMITLSEYLAEQRRFKEALYLVDILIKKSPNDSSYWAWNSNRCLDLELYNRAMVASRKSNKLSNGNEAWILANIGNIFNRRGLYTKATPWLEKSLKVSPNYEYAHSRMATALKEQEEENREYIKLCKEGGRLLHTNKEKTPVAME